MGKNLQKLNQFISTIGKDPYEGMTKRDQFISLLKLTTSSLTREEFINSFKQVLDFCKKAVQDLSQKYQDTISRTEVEISSKLSSLEEKVDTKLSEVKDGYTPIKGKDYFDGLKGDDGVTPDTAEVALKASTMAQDALKPLLPTIDQLEKKLPILGEKIRDGLELLQGDERLEIKAIKDLEERLSELKKEFGKTRFVGGGGFNRSAMEQYFVDDDTPVEVPNGVITDFTPTYIPLASSLKVFNDGQRMKLGATKDYTFSGGKVIYNTAPLADVIITFDYRRS